MATSNIPVNNPKSFSIRQHVDDGFLKRSFSSSIQKVVEVEGQVKELRSSSKGEKSDSNLEQDLTVYASHFLAKGAKLAVYDEDRDTQLPYLEFYGDSHPKYFRSQGGSAVTLYTDLLKNGPYKNLFKPYDRGITDTVGLIKSDKFRHCLKLQYDVVRISPRKQASLKEKSQQLDFITKFAPSSSSKTTFLDVSTLITPSSTDRIDAATLNDRLDEIKRAIRENKNDLSNVMIGAFFKLEDGQDVYILLNDHMLNSTDSDEDVLKKVHHNDEEMKENKAHAGYFPDIIQIRKHLFQNGVKIETLRELYPFEMETVNAPSSNVDRPLNVEQRLNVIAGKFKEKSESKEMAEAHYFGLFADLFKGIELSLKEAKGSEDQELIEAFAHRSLDVVEQMIEAMGKNPSVENYQQFLGNVDLITEEIVFLLALYKPMTNSINDTLNHTGVQFESKTAKKDSFVFTSGMNSFNHVMGALRKSNPNPSEKLKAGFSSTNYFELRLNVKPHTKEIFEIEDGAVDPFKPITEDYDVFFMDIYPNEVTLPSVDRVDPEKVITNLLKNRNGKPLTVIIDTSTSLFSGDDIQKTVDRFKTEIEDGRLNLVVVNSLAKFSMSGLDKYTGGVVQVYNNNGKAFEEFNNYLIKRQSQERLSQEAEQFFNLIFTHAHHDIHLYLERVNANTEKFYQMLAPLQDGNTAISLAEKKSDRIPMISLQFDHAIKLSTKNLPKAEDEANQMKANISMLMQYYIYAKAKGMGLPLDIRLSFGFAHSSLNECWIALRVTVGLENEETLQKYKELVFRASQELEEALEQPDFMELVKSPDGMLYEKFKNVEQRVALLQGVRKENNFAAFVTEANTRFNGKTVVATPQTDVQEAGPEEIASMEGSYIDMSSDRVDQAASRSGIFDTLKWMTSSVTRFVYSKLWTRETSQNFSPIQDV